MLKYFFGTDHFRLRLREQALAADFVLRMRGQSNRSLMDVIQTSDSSQTSERCFQADSSPPRESC